MSDAPVSDVGNEGCLKEDEEDAFFVGELLPDADLITDSFLNKRNGGVLALS